MPTARGRLIALAAGLCLAGCGPPAERALQGYVEGEYVRVAAPFAGTLQKLAAYLPVPAAAGAPLFALESDNEIAARRQAEQQLQAAEARGLPNR